MYLIKEEKRTLVRFLLLYLGSSFILFGVIAYLFYQNETNSYYERVKTTLQMKANRLSSKIIYAHMMKREFSLEKLVKSSKEKIGFYDKENRAIASSIEDKIDFSKNIYITDNKMVLVDRSTFGHLGVESIVIEREGIYRFVNDLRYKIILMLFLIYIFLGVVGYFLAKLFIKPIQLKRIQLDNFIKDSTHELNTPITALMLSVNSPMVQTPKNLERIRLSASRVSAIYKDLTYLMLDSRSRENQVVDRLLLNDIVKEELSYLILLAEKKKIKVNLYDREKIYFKIDKESFVRLIHNLISNAIKYNTIGGTIDITLNNKEIIVKDTGVGIAKEHQKGVYERFYRATEQVGGFGLGLNIVHKVCSEYGIEIEFESKVGEGTVFYLLF